MQTINTITIDTTIDTTINTIAQATTEQIAYDYAIEPYEQNIIEI